MRAMTQREQSRFNALYQAVDRARDLLEDANAGAPDQDEDLRVACARLDDWLLENHKRWVTDDTPLVRDPESWQAVAAEGAKWR